MSCGGWRAEELHSMKEDKQEREERGSADAESSRASHCGQLWRALVCMRACVCLCGVPVKRDFQSEWSSMSIPPL